MHQNRTRAVFGPAWEFPAIHITVWVIILQCITGKCFPLDARRTDWLNRPRNRDPALMQRFTNAPGGNMVDGLQPATSNLTQEYKPRV